MAAKDAVEYSNQCLETMNRLPHPQEIWDAALESVEEKILQSASPTNTGSPKCATDNLVRAFANTLTEYMERSMRCRAASPEECKKMMTIDFPSIQTMAMRNAIECIGRLPFESKKAAEEIMEYLKTHSGGNGK